MTDPIDVPEGAPRRRSDDADAASPARTVPTPPARRTERGVGGHHLDTSSTSPVSFLEAFSAISVPIRPGLRISATVVLALSVAGLIALFALGSTWVFGALIAAAGIGVAAGWNSLSGIDLPLPTLAVLSLAAAGIPLDVIVQADLGAAVPLIGVTFAALVASIVFTAPAPVDHYRDGEGLISRSAPSSSEDAAGGGVARRRRASGRRLVASTHAIASAASALMLIAGGPSWLALVTMHEGALIAPIVCIIVAAVVWGDQIGATFRHQSVWATIVAVIAGGAAAVGMLSLGRSASLTPVILPELASRFGEPVAVAVFGVCAGLAVALVIVLIDGLLGDHVLRRPPLAAIARGCAKFLIAGIPVYALIRTGGI